MDSAGCFIEPRNENAYVQIGEAKCGKPIINRVVTPATPLDEAAECVLISTDSTLRSNISCRLPLDLLIYETNELAVTRFVTIDENQYSQMIRSTCGQQLKRVFEGIADPMSDASPDTTANVLSAVNMHCQPARIAPSVYLASGTVHPAPLQTLAQQSGGNKQHLFFTRAKNPQSLNRAHVV